MVRGLIYDNSPFQTAKRKGSVSRVMEMPHIVSATKGVLPQLPNYNASHLEVNRKINPSFNKRTGGRPFASPLAGHHRTPQSDPVPVGVSGTRPLFVTHAVYGEGS